MPDVDLLDALLDSVGALDAHGALRLVERAVGTFGVDATVTELLAATQHEVGRRWEFGEWTVSQEHGATAIVDMALSLLGDAVPPPDAPRLALVCAEGEWHVTPARMASLRLRQRGWHVTFLGASTPGPHLARTLRDMRPDVVAVSCTLAVNLPGGRQTIEVAHQQGLPVLAGGAALGGGGHRAHVVGADAAGTDLDLLAATARSWLDTPPALRSGRAHHVEEVERLRRGHDDIVAGTASDLLAALPWLSAAPPEHLEHTVEDLGWILRHLAVSLDTDDPAVLTDLVDWLAGLLAVRGASRDALTVGLEAIRRRLGPELPAASARLGEAAAA